MRKNHTKEVTLIEAIAETKLVELTFNSNHKGTLTRTCVPMDYGPSNRFSSSNELRYHFIDISSEAGPHPLSITEDKIVSLRKLEIDFEPKNWVTWTPSWHIVRDWGIYS